MAAGLQILCSKFGCAKNEKIRSKLLNFKYVGWIINIFYPNQNHKDMNKISG